MSRHRVYADSFPNSGNLIVGGNEAHHALRTRRLEVGDSRDVLGGRGRVARFAEHTMRVETTTMVAVGVNLDHERRAAPPGIRPVSSAQRNAP